MNVFCRLRLERINIAIKVLIAPDERGKRVRTCPVMILAYILAQVK